MVNGMVPQAPDRSPALNSKTRGIQREICFYSPVEMPNGELNMKTMLTYYTDTDWFSGIEIGPAHFIPEFGKI